MKNPHNNVKDKHAFHVINGNKVQSLYDLSIELADMDDKTFKHHVKEDNNDFENWIYHIIKDEKLAADIAKAKDKEHMLKILQKRILELKHLEDQEKLWRSRKNMELLRTMHWGKREFAIGLIVGIVVFAMVAKMTGLM